MAGSLYKAALVGIATAILGITPVFAQKNQAADRLHNFDKLRTPPPQGYTPPPTGASYHTGILVAAVDRGYLATPGVRKKDFPVTFDSDWATPPPDDGYALRSFRFRFTNGDHKLQRMGITPSNTRRPGQTRPNYIVNFHDQQPDDSFNFSATVIDLNGIAVRDPNAPGARSWRELPETYDITPEERQRFQCMDGKGRVPLLAGFTFARHRDSNVREIGAMCLPRLVETCTKGIDGQCLPPSRSSVELKATYDVLWKHEGGVDLRTLDRAFGSDGGDAQGRVDLVWVPSSIIEECRLFHGRDVRSFIQTVQGRRFALMGFKFEFLNTDHHIMDIGVVPQSPDEQIYFQDSNRDDSFQFRVQLCFFK